MKKGIVKKWCNKTASKVKNSMFFYPQIPWGLPHFNLYFYTALYIYITYAIVETYHRLALIDELSWEPR